MEYDFDSRLTSERWLNSSHQELYAFAWDYDLAGNRVYQNRNGVETYFVYNADNALIHKITDAQTSYFTYDSRGNCILIEEVDGATYLSYNHANLVTSIRYKSGVSNYFYYDSLLRRYALEDSDGLRYFTWDNSGTKLLDERDINGNVTAYYTHGYSYVPGIGTMVAAKKNENETAYYQFPAMDHRGSVYRLANENNEIVATYEYNAFGEPLQNQETGATNRFMYQSNWISLKDSDDTIVLSPSRLYSTATGQFLQKDFLFQMTLLKQKGMYWNSIFRKRRRSIFGVDNYGLHRAFENPYKYTDSLGLEIFVYPRGINYVYTTEDGRKGVASPYTETVTDAGNKMANALQKVVGDCATITVEAHYSKIFERYEKVGTDPNSDDVTGRAIYTKHLAYWTISYKDENCDCNNIVKKAWLRLKALIDDSSNIYVYFQNIPERAGFLGSGIRTGGEVLIDYEYIDAMESNNLPVYDEDGNPIRTPVEIAIWHEVVAHGGEWAAGRDWLHRFVNGRDPINEIENEARQAWNVNNPEDQLPLRAVTKIE